MGGGNGEGAGGSLRIGSGPTGSVQGNERHNSYQGGATPGPGSGLGIVSSGLGRAGHAQGKKMFGGLVPTPLGSPEAGVASP
jgi:hypothetical protein